MLSKNSLILFIGLISLQTQAQAQAQPQPLGFTFTASRHEISNIGVGYVPEIVKADFGTLSLGLEIRSRTIDDVNGEDWARNQVSMVVAVDHPLVDTLSQVYQFGAGGDFGQDKNYGLVFQRFGLRMYNKQGRTSSIIGMEMMLSIKPPKVLEERMETISFGPFLAFII